ncbi:MAG: hypothetical protein P1U41_02060 [Vicingaceae bacterium]|nr:hypothetical protein [Vicingaceae bacterium]
MKRFILNWVIFSIPIIALLYPLDVLISINLKKSNAHSYGEYSVWNDIFEGKINSEILIYGSSRSWVNINPYLIEKGLGKTTYNLGIDGHNFWLQYLRHKTFLKYNNQPKTIIVSVDPFTFQKREDLYNSDQFLPYLLFNTNFNNSLNSYIGYSTYDCYIPCLRYIGKKGAINTVLKMILKKDEQKKGRLKGFMPIDEEWNKDLVETMKKMKHYEIKYHQPTIQLFKRFISECKKADIDLIFIYTPEHILGQNFIKDRNMLIDLIDKISSDNNIPFIDYSKDSICFDKKYFYNSNHLNAKGTQNFAIKLIKDLKPIVQ